MYATEISKIKIKAESRTDPTEQEWVQTETWIEGDRRFFRFPFHRPLMAEIKAMHGARWHGHDDVNPRKLWSVFDNRRNKFQLDSITKDVPDPYGPWNSALVPTEIPPRWNKSHKALLPPLKHQPLMTAHMIQRPGCIVAGEMGTGKTFCCMIALEHHATKFFNKYGEQPEIWYVAPRSALRAVMRDMAIWGTPLNIQFMTYEEMVKRVKPGNWIPGRKPPPVLVLDESSKVKTQTSQRSQAAQGLADAIRDEWPEDYKIILMTGTPAPKSPSDWYSQCEIACPGFIREGDIHKFNNRLGIIIKKERFDGGGMYPQLVSWRDDANKCNKCGKYANDDVHKQDGTQGMTGDDPDANHPWEPSKNEVEYLYKRLQGLVIIFFKKDCLDLPDKTYRVMEVKPAPSTLRAAGLITKAAKTTIEGLTRLRELSDGFQYNEIKQGKETCDLCGGSKVCDDFEEIPGTCPNCTVQAGEVDGLKTEVPTCPQHLPNRIKRQIPCTHCGGTGEQDKIVRETTMVTCPKDQVLIDLLDEYEDVGRVVIFAGFTASLDRVVSVCQKQKWWVIRLDQGKEQIFDENGRIVTDLEYLDLFQDQLAEHPRVAFVAHPGSGGMGLTLTASPVVIYFSNDFNGEYRSQSEDRIHRPGMDLNLGATIIDIIHLPSDLKVRDNLRAKRKLELMSLGELGDALKSGEGHDASTR